MAFKKGHSKKGGRTKGTPNKSNQFPRQILIDLLAAQGDKPMKELKKLEGKEYIECYDKLMKYILPQLKAVEHGGSVEQKGGFNFIIEKNYIKDDDSDET